MKKTYINYILAFTVILCLITSITIFIYADFHMQGMIKKLSDTTIMSGFSVKVPTVEGGYDFSKVYIFVRSMFILLLSVGIGTSLLVFFLTKRIFQTQKYSDVQRNDTYTKLITTSDKVIPNEIDETLNTMKDKITHRDLELKDKSIELENVTRALQEREDKLEYDKLKTEFFANISHEFKTPLNILMGAMQLLELYASNGTIKDPELKLDKYLKTMKQNALRLLRLINNIIDLTKIDSSYFHMELHNYDIVSIVESIIQSINIYAKVKSINISFKKEIEEEIMACDADKIERILLNLLSNAIKFTDENGNIEVKIGTRENIVYISVKDDGIGIPEDKLELIFQRFRQVDKTFTRNREGSGIGLSLVKSLVEMHEGKIIVQSQYGEGTEFIVELPVTIMEEDMQIDMYSQYEDTRLERIRVEFSDI